MSIDGLVFGLLDTSCEIGDPIAAATYRAFTISWSRYGYHDVILEKNTIDDILGAAVQSGYRYCFIQPYGHVIQERWCSAGRSSGDFFSVLEAWIDQNEFLVMGPIAGDDERWFGFAPGCLLVDLEKYRRLGAPSFGDACDVPCETPRAAPIMRDGQIAALRPSDGNDSRRKPRIAGWQMIAASLKSGLPVAGLSEDLSKYILNLEATCPARREALARYLGNGIVAYRREEGHDDLSRDQVELLNVIDRQTKNARRGVFLWNIESYADIETPTRDFKSPISSLYSVAAGFKPNRILQTHGFDEHSRVVFFDYSPNALAVRKCMVDEWTGEDFPDFVEHLFRKFPHPETFYQLWDDLSPNDVKRSDIEKFWQRELNRWGDARTFGEHWRAYRKLGHQYVCCDIMTDPTPVLDKIAEERSAIIWWSNAFFTMYGNWFYALPDRKRMYDRWIDELAARNPNLCLFGSDYSNVNVNSIQAGDYREQYRQSSSNCLIPAKLYVTEMRM